jgi:flagellar export protein FliJ
MRKFKLQSLLDYRKRQADEACQNVALSMEKKNAIETARHEAEKERQRLCRELEAAKAGFFRLEEIMLYEQCICAKQRRVCQLDEKLAEAEKEVERKQKDLVAARQKKKVLQILKEKRVDAEEKKQARHEAVFLDEVSILGYGGGR